MRQVELLGKKYTAERLTQIALLGVVGGFVDKQAATPADMVAVLTDPNRIEKMAYWLSYIFPGLAEDGIVWHGAASHPKAGIDLELPDLLTLLVKLMEWTTGDKFQEWVEKQEAQPTPEPVTANPEVAALNAQIEALAKQLESLKPDKNPVAQMDAALAQTLLNS